MKIPIAMVYLLAALASYWSSSVQAQSRCALDLKDSGYDWSRGVAKFNNGDIAFCRVVGDRPDWRLVCTAIRAD